HSTDTVKLLLLLAATAAARVYSLSLHDALPIWRDAPREGPELGEAALDVLEALGEQGAGGLAVPVGEAALSGLQVHDGPQQRLRSEEHTSELQSRENLVCRLLLEKKNKTTKATK